MKFMVRKFNKVGILGNSPQYFAKCPPQIKPIVKPLPPFIGPYFRKYLVLFPKQYAQKYKMSRNNVWEWCRVIFTSPLRGQRKRALAYALAPQPYFHAVVTWLPERSIVTQRDRAPRGNWKHGRSRRCFIGNSFFYFFLFFALPPFDIGEQNP